MPQNPHSTPRRRLLLAGVGLALGAVVVQAGDLAPPAAPNDVDSALFTLQDLFDRLDNGRTGRKRDDNDSFAEPANGPTAGTMHTLDEIMAKMPAVDDTNGAAVDNVLQGKTFWGLTSGGWGPKTGTLAKQTPTADSVSQLPGIYEAFDLSNVDPDLKKDNIKSGMTLFGVAGDSAVVDTSDANAAAGEILKDKTAYVQGQLVTGTVVAGGNVSGANGAISFTIPDGFYSGSKTCTASDTDLTAGNVKSGVSIFNITGSYTCTEPTGNAIAAEVLSGKTFSTAAGIGLTGSMPDKEGDNASTGQAYSAGGPIKLTAPTGFYDGGDTVTATQGQIAALDPDLLASNVRSGVTIFGVTGTYTGSGGTTPPAFPVPRTGQTACYAFSGGAWSVSDCSGTHGQDGQLQKGVAWPVPRFTCNPNGVCDELFIDNDDGTVTDQLTGLVWLKNSNCIETVGGIDKPVEGVDWSTAMAWVAVLKNGSCGLTDGSAAGQWRLPTVKELSSLVDAGAHSPAVPNDGVPFEGNPSDWFWSSTTSAIAVEYLAWSVSLIDGRVRNTNNIIRIGAWPVRGG